MQRLRDWDLNYNENGDVSGKLDGVKKKNLFPTEVMFVLFDGEVSRSVRTAINHRSLMIITAEH